MQSVEPHQNAGGPAILAGSGSCHVCHSSLLLHLHGNLPLLAHKNRSALIPRLQLKLPEACLHKTLQIIHRFLRGEILVECLLSDKLLCLEMQDAFRQYRTDLCFQKIVLLRLPAGRGLDQTLIKKISEYTVKLSLFHHFFSPQPPRKSSGSSIRWAKSLKRFNSISPSDSR